MRNSENLAEEQNCEMNWMLFNCSSSSRQEIHDKLMKANE